MTPQSDEESRDVSEVTVQEESSVVPQYKEGTRQASCKVPISDEEAPE